VWGPMGGWGGYLHSLREALYSFSDKATPPSPKYSCHVDIMIQSLAAARAVLDKKPYRTSDEIRTFSGAETTCSVASTS